MQEIIKALEERRAGARLGGGSRALPGEVGTGSPVRQREH